MTKQQQGRHPEQLQQETHMSICTIPELRQQLEIASFLAKSHVGFVVMPVTDRAQFVALTLKAAESLNELAAAQEGGAA